MAIPSEAASVAGRRLLHVTIDEISAKTPERIWGSIPRSGDLSDGYRDISYRKFANAINRLSWFLESKVGKSTTFETVTYIGLPDMRYHIFSMAVAKTGHKALFSSHMNSLAGHLNLFAHCDCQNIVSARGIKIDDILSSRPMHHIEMPELSELLNEEVVPPYPYEKTFEQARLDRYLVLHTSGSTGLPKPITLNHAFIAAIDATLNSIPEMSGGRPTLKKSTDGAEPVRIFSPFAPFHVISVTQMMTWTVFGNIIYVFGPPDRMTTPQDALNIFIYANVKKAWCSPAMLEAFATIPSAVESLSKLSMVMYGGGALSESTGSKISKVTQLVNTWGTCENAMPVLLETDPEDWDYIAFAPELNGFDWRPTGENQFELVIVQRPEVRHLQPTFAIFPDLRDWPTRDIWTPHPQKPHHWRYGGRLDDMICYAHGLKYHPAIEETNLCANPLIRSAIMIGDQRAQSALLVELRNVASPQTDEERERLMSKIWPTIAEANALAPSIAQIAESHVVFASAEKPFVRAGKDTVVRQLSIDLYAEEIDQMYAREGDKSASLLSRATT